MSSLQANASEKKKLSPQEFISTAAVEYFKSGQYKQAAEEFETLKSNFPEDPFVQRYLGITYQKMGRYEKAIEIFKEALTIAPQNAATHFYLAETLIRLSRLEEARKAYERVIEYDPISRYAESARERIQRIDEAPETIEDIFPEAPRRWRAYLGMGYEYDGNATFTSRQPNLRVPEDQNAGRFMSEEGFSYELLSRPTWFVDFDYSASQTFYDDDLRRLNTYSNTWDVSLTRIFMPRQKPLIVQIRESLTHVVLDQKFFLFVTNLSGVVISNFHKRHQAMALYSFAYNEFENNSEDKQVSGRDGFTHSVALLHTYYIDESKSTRFVWGYSYQRDEVDGANFIRDVHGARATLYFPVKDLFEVETGFVYRHDERPHFIADTEDGTRRDDIWEVTVRLNKTLAEHHLVSTFFTYERAFSRNNTFEYVRPYGGASYRFDF